MFKVLRIDGPNLVTDLGCVALTPFQYADGGKTHPVSPDDWRKMRDLFVLAPELLAACRLAASDATVNGDHVNVVLTKEDFVAILAVLAKVAEQEPKASG